MFLHSMARITFISIIFTLLIYQQLAAQSYINVNFSNSTNKYSLISDIKEITFSGTNITFKKNDNSTTTETISSISDITFDASAGSGSPLPVELVSFFANNLDNKVILNWTTATEVNNYGFEVERCETQDVRDESWRKIGFMNGHGNSNSTKEYSFIDETAASGSFSYRLKQIDFDGAFEYSKVVSIQLVVPQDYQLAQNYPNPFNPITVISFQLPIKSFTTLKVYDILGKEVASLVNEEKEAGKYSISFNGSQLASGVYFSRMTAGSYTFFIKMLMVK